MKKPARQILKESLERQNINNKNQRLQLIYILNSCKNEVEKNLKTYEALTYLIEKQNMLYEELSDIENYIANNQLTDINVVNEISKKLAITEDITKILPEKIMAFLFFNSIFGLKNMKINEIMQGNRLENIYKKICDIDSNLTKKIDEKCKLLKKVN